MSTDKMTFTFKVTKEFVLRGYQSPRGARYEDKRPQSVHLKIDREFNRLELEKHIKYLHELLTALE